MKRYLFLILALAFFLRFIKIGEIPPGISHDELENINNGISLIKTGKDLSGNFLPLTVGGVGLVAIPAYISGVGAILFGQSILGVRVLAVLMGTANILFLYFIAKKLTNEKVALVSSAVYAVSPWGIHFSRMIYDPPVALFFALFGISTLLYANKKNILFGWIFIGLALLSYYGYIFTIPFLALLLIWYKRKNLKKAGIISGVSVLAFFYLILGLMISSPDKMFASERTSEILFLQTERLSQKVIFERSQSIAPEFLNRVFVNKGTVAIREVKANYLSAMSPENIFSFGEESKVLSPENVGFMYLFEISLVIAGAYLLFRKNRKSALFVIGVIFIAPVTMAFGDERTYVARASLMFPFLILLVGVAIDNILERARKRGLSAQAFLFFVGIYCLSLTAFLYQYLFRYPLYAREIWNESEREISQFLINNPNQEIMVSTVEPRETFMTYAFFSRLSSQEMQGAYRASGPIFIKKAMFTNCILPSEKPEGVTLLLDADCGQSMENAVFEIKSLDGSNSTKWGLFIDQVIQTKD